MCVIKELSVERPDGKKVLQCALPRIKGENKNRAFLSVLEEFSLFPRHFAYKRAHEKIQSDNDVDLLPFIRGERIGGKIKKKIDSAFSLTFSLNVVAASAAETLLGYTNRVKTGGGGI